MQVRGGVGRFVNRKVDSVRTRVESIRVKRGELYISALEVGEYWTMMKQ